jgi:hypothetical protein
MDCSCKQSAVGSTIEEGGPYVCGGYCMYEWAVNLKMTKLKNGNICMEPESDVEGPRLRCNRSNQVTDAWVTEEDLKNCVSIDEDKNYKMKYYSYDKDMTQCTCDEYTNACPSDPGWKPSPPRKSWIIPCTDEVPEEPPAAYVTEEFPSRTFLLEDEYGNLSYESVCLWVDESTGLPMELNDFPEDLKQNGKLKEDSEEFYDYIDSLEGLFALYTVRFYDNDGYPWSRSGYFIDVGPCNDG